jgi:error-prone DNA polymerase
MKPAWQIGGLAQGDGGFRKVIMRARIIDVRGMVQHDADVIPCRRASSTDRGDALERLSNDRVKTHHWRAPMRSEHVPNGTTVIHAMCG